jgi:hypothetical protein
MERLPWRGPFSLSEQLYLKKTRFHTTGSFTQMPTSGYKHPVNTGSLIGGIRAADEASSNYINYLEFVSCPGENFGVNATGLPRSTEARLSSGAMKCTTSVVLPDT